MGCHDELVPESSQRATAVSIEGLELTMDIAGLGLILYSPGAMPKIAPKTNFLRSGFMDPESVASHARRGDLVGFCTSSPGTYILRFHEGYPPAIELDEADFKLRLGVICKGGQLCVRDLYDLISWDPNCPANQVIPLPDGEYHVTLCGDRPSSGVLGDDQLVEVWLNPLPKFPELKIVGVPTYC
jgi:hypothetical protein